MATPSPTSSASAPPPLPSSPPPPPPLPSSSSSPPPPSDAPPPSSPPPPSDAPPPLPSSPPPPSDAPPPLPSSPPPPSDAPPPLPSSPPPPSDAPPPSSPPPPFDAPPDSTPPLSPPLPTADSPPPPPDSTPSPPSPDSPSTPGSNNPPIAPEPPLAPPIPSSGSSPPPGDYSPPSPPPGDFSPPSSSPPPPSGDFSPPSSSPPPLPRKKHLSPPPPSTVILPSPSNSSLGSPITQFPQKVPSPPNPSNDLSTPESSVTYTPDSSGSSGRVSSSTAAGIGAAAAVAVLFLAMLIWCMRRRKKYDGRYSGEYQNPSPLTSSQVSGTSTPFRKTPSVPLMIPNSINQVNIYSADNGRGNSKSWFTYEELAQATNGFSFQNLLGEGGFGCVYKGFLSEGREVAVKQLKVGGSQGEREFQAEVEIISRVHHRHLVSLVGYCISENQRLLVYDFVPNDTLYYHLHGKGRPVMDWPTRVKVAAGAARGLAYLHEDCHPRIIHRDIKSSNILLDNNFEAQVSDFGLAKLTEDTNTHVTTRVMGTFGYLAPEYASSGKLTDRSDVFSFGVVLLELITGRRPVDSSQPLGEESLVEWARPLMITALETEKFDKLPDPRLQNNYSELEMFRIIEAASACVRYNAQMRPRMGRVMRALDNIADSMDINNGVKPGQTQVFNGPTNLQDMKSFHKMAFGSQDYSSDFSKNSYL